MSTKAISFLTAGLLIALSSATALASELLELAGTNWDGTSFRLSDERGRVAIVFFGCTDCPHTPILLTELASLARGLRREARDLSVIYIGAYPERDTLERLGAFVPRSVARFRAVRVEPEQLAAAGSAFGVPDEVRYPVDGWPDRFFDRAGSFFVFDRAGVLRAVLPVGTEIGELQGHVRKLLLATPESVTVALDEGNPAHSWRAFR